MLEMWFEALSFLCERVAARANYRAGAVTVVHDLARASYIIAHPSDLDPGYLHFWVESGGVHGCTISISLPMEPVR